MGMFSKVTMKRIFQIVALVGTIVLQSLAIPQRSQFSTKRKFLSAALILRPESKKDSHFVGEVKTRWMVTSYDKDRKIVLLENFTFIDNKGRKWMAPKGEPIDGATIPKMLWPVAGSPFVGYYRRASVVHDIYCYPHYRHLASSKDVHKMFHEACLTDGVKPWKARWV